jgi:membrane-bound inhibitor of C-type lysozyme
MMATVGVTVSAIGRHPALVAAAFVFGVQLAGCEHQIAKDAAEDAAKPTFVCQLAGAPLIIRFEPGEVRLLTSNADRVTLYQIPAASGIRYSNASLELRGKGMDLVLIDNGVPSNLEGCVPYVAPKPAS